ncbi:MAG: T9SS type A sorting domain-containing protein [Lewinellaceae bacterium]|nr:T9SS type A sorting domain-containing protein [Lewinellaceae bacterium]
MKSFLPALFLVFHFAAHTQPASTRQPEVLASAGGFAMNVGSYSLSFTVGEAIISTLTPTGQDIQLSQGFQQPTFDTIVSAGEQLPPGWHFRCYPNPAGHMLNLRLDAPLNADITVSLWNIAGFQALESQKMPVNTLTRLDLSKYAQGIYLLNLKSANGLQYTHLLVLTGR